MVLQNGDFVRIDFTGRIKETGKVFDTTVEKVAKDNDIYDENTKFRAAPIVVGANHVLKGLDEALVGAEVGEKKKVSVPPEKAYGDRDPNLVKIIPMREFKKEGMSPVPGMVVEIDNKMGRVQSVGAGRVRVDFNHGLAGKALDYEVDVKEKVNKAEEKIRLLLELHFPYAEANDHEIALKAKKVNVALADIVKMRQDAAIGKHYVARDVFKFMDAVDEIVFEEAFKRPAPPKKAKAESGAKKKAAKKTPAKKKAPAKKKS